MRRVAIVGCRPPKGFCVNADEHDADGNLYVLIDLDVRAFCWALPEDAIVVTGGAAGVDQIPSAILGRERVKVYRPVYPHAWDGCEVCRRAPLRRNELVVADATEVHAWPAPWSRGTWHAAGLARRAGKPPMVHEPWKAAGRARP